MRHTITMDDNQFKALEALLWQCNAQFMLEGIGMDDLLSAFMFLDSNAHHPYATKGVDGSCIINLEIAEIDSMRVAERAAEARRRR